MEVRKIEAWVAAAHAATTPEEAVRCLLAGADQALSFHDWRLVLDGLLGAAVVPPEMRRALATRALRAAALREEIWGFHDVAVFEGTELDDREAARQTLREGERMLLERASHGRGLGYEWGVLAGGFATALGDKEDARRCLKAGWALAWGQRDVENLGRLANQWAKMLDPAEAAQRLSLVEEAARGWGNLGGLIYWWQALGDAPRGRRVRQTTLETTEDVKAVLDLVRYWDLYEKGSPGVEAALSRAEELALTASEWFDLAQVAGHRPPNTALCRRALDRAAERVRVCETPDSEALSTCIASAYVDWFHDEAAAASVGPRGLRPDRLPIGEGLGRLAGWEDSASDLFDWLRDRVAPEELLLIANADYGDDVKEHLAALEAICRTGLVPIVLAWHPGEVVALTRWSSGDDVRHLPRALSCALLVLASNEDSLANTAPVLVESCLALGDEAAAACERFFVWRWEEEGADGGEALVCLLSLFLLRVSRDPDDARLTALVDLMQSPPSEIRGLREQMAGSLRADLWTALIDRILTPLVVTQAAVRPLLEALGLA